MTLDKDEYKLFLKTHLDLLYFVGLKRKFISSDTDFNTFIDFNQDIKFKCRQELSKNFHLLDEYLQTHFYSLTTDQIKVVKNFKKKISGEFIILKCLKRHAIFIDTKSDSIYTVKALSDTFDNFFSHFPVMCRATILPFKDKIIYDGFIQSHEIYIGRNMTSELNEQYKKAKKHKTLIMTIE